MGLRENLDFLILFGCGRGALNSFVDLQLLVGLADTRWVEESSSI